MKKQIHRVVVDIPTESWLSIKEESRRTGLSIKEIWTQMLGVEPYKIEILAKKWKWILDE